MTIDLMVWGTGIDHGALTRKLNERWPALADAHLEAEPLSSTVKTSFGEKLGHNLFHIDVLEGTEEEMRAQILEQIYASVRGRCGRGRPAGRRSDHHRRRDDHEGDGVQTEDEMIIEIKSE